MTKTAIKKLLIFIMEFFKAGINIILKNKYLFNLLMFFVFGIDC